MKAAESPDQSRITSYYSIIDSIEHLSRENQKLAATIRYLTVNDQEGTITSNPSFGPVLKSIIANAEKNASKLPKGRRHPEILKKFSTALFIFAGPLAYEFIQQNLPQALPCLRTVQAIVHNEYSTVVEGDFRFDELLHHIRKNDAPMVVTIGEDATRVVARVEYDSETDRCIGFVLPSTENGLPIVDSFKAVSFTAIERMFSENAIAKYAYVYMAQPLKENIPPFCLACIGTDNKFTYETVLQRWKYIIHECKKRHIDVVSIGGDGDSRLMKAMRMATGLSTDMLSLSEASSLKLPKIPPTWSSWFKVESLSNITCVQDIVHIAVKLKCRLIRPSILLPLGDYVAGCHHLRLLQFTYGKDQHGLRERDIDYKDKQNYDAVLNIFRASSLLENIPDAVGTKCYVEIMQCVVDSYLNKCVEPLIRIEKMWYAVFFLRYWRMWIMLCPQYTLQNNFITNNAYMCVELNAHALIIFLMTVRDNFHSECFLPWMLGSQSCEKKFRAARSMTSTFSTIINFGMLGLLRRLHRLQIQATLQAESDETGISFPRAKKHLSKDGQDKFVQHSLKDITTESICSAVNRAQINAKAAMEKLGMLTLLEKHKAFEKVSPTCELPMVDDSDEDEVEEEASEPEQSNVIEAQIQEVCTEDPGFVKKDIEILYQSSVIDPGMKERLQTRQKSLPIKRLPSTTVPMFSPENDMKSRKFSPFVQVEFNSGRCVLIRKTTAVWLFQEGERVSSDRLFRVRCKQPYSSCQTKSQNATQNVTGNAQLPIVSSSVQIGECCVFKRDNGWSIGRVLQFSKYKEKSVSAMQFQGHKADVCKTDIGVLCCWYAPSPVPGSNSHSFQLVKESSTSSSCIITHSYHPLNTYVCTLTTDNFIFQAETKSIEGGSIMKLDHGQIQLYTAEQLVISDETVSLIDKAADLKSSKSPTSANHPTSFSDKKANLKSSKSTTPANYPASLSDKTADLKSSKSPTPASFIDKTANLKSSKSPTHQDAVLIVDTGKVVNPKSCKSPKPVCNTQTVEAQSIMINEEVKPNEEVWIVIDRTYLYRTDKQVLDDDNQWLNDKHITCAQLLLKEKFPELTGLNPTILQAAGCLEPFPRGSKSVQILHVNGDHWMTVSTVDCTAEEDIIVYDSKYSSLSQETKLLLSQLVHTDKPTFQIKMANVSKQSGTTACGLYAIAYATHVAFGRDPCVFIFKQKEMRQHLTVCFEKKELTPFPTTRGKRSVFASRPNVLIVKVYCYCRCTDVGERMVRCDGQCREWYHVKCVDYTGNKKWYCTNCHVP